MIVIENIVKDFGEMIDEAERSILNEWVEQEISAETSITERFLESMKIRINESESMMEKGVIVKARTLSDRGPDSEEHRFGADFAIILNINLSNYKVQKGFLCQAKLERRGFNVSLTKNLCTVNFSQMSSLRGLQNQTEKMLKISPDSFVVIYSFKSFIIVPAISVNSLIMPNMLYGKKVSNFFKEFLMCFIGDRNITLETKNWEEIKTSVKTALEITIEGKEPEKSKKFPPSDFGFPKTEEKILKVC